MENVNFEEFKKKRFSSQDEFDKYLSELQSSHYVIFRRRSSRQNKNETTSELFPFYSIRFQCIHFGKPRIQIKDGSRPNQHTSALDCECYFVVELGVDEKLVLTQHHFEHNHPQTKESTLKLRLNLRLKL